MPPVINKSTDAGLAEEVMTFYNRTLLQRLMPNLVWPMFGQPRPMPTNAGQTMNFRGFNSLPLATAGIAEGVTPDGEALDMYNLSVVPKQYGDYVKVTDVVDLQSFDPVLTEVAELLGEQAAATYDVLVRDIVSAGTNAQFAGTAHTQSVQVAVGDKISLVEIRKAVRTMHTNKVKKLTSMLNASTGVGTKPIPACYVAICSPSTVYDLKGIAEFLPVHQYPAGQMIHEDEVGSLDEVRFIKSDQAKVLTGAGAGGIDVHATVIFARDAFGVVSLQGIQNIIKGFGAGDDALNQRMTSGWKAFFTSVILQQLAILRLEHAVS